jgi:two-component system phosphate regulon response regulator PhoB
MTTPRLLVVEDESAIAELLSINLRHAGFSVTVAASAEEARLQVDRELPALVVLDWMLPGQSGVALCRQWRAQARTRDLPVILLTARAEENDQVAGLESGADDYLTKPFSPKTLVARIRAVLRRRAPQALDDAVQAGALRLDPATRRVLHDGGEDRRELKIGPTEFRLLHFLMTHPDRVHSRSQLLDRVWGDHVFIEERTVDVHIKRLREVLATVGEAMRVETVRGAGYRFVPDAQATHRTGVVAGRPSNEVDDPAQLCVSPAA